MKLSCLYCYHQYYSCYRITVNMVFTQILSTKLLGNPWKQNDICKTGIPRQGRREKIAARGRGGGCRGPGFFEIL